MENNLIIAGVDEVGRGCLAGPVVSAAVILNDKIDLKLIDDSKKINFQNRLKIAEIIKQNSYYAIGTASVEEIFKINILQAALLSMKRAIDKLEKKPSQILIDGPFAPKGLKNYKTIIKGDEKTISEIRGKWFEKKIGTCNTSIIASFHPAFLMRQPHQKKLSWVDLKMIRKKILDLKINIGK